MRIKTFQWIICALIAGLVLNGVAYAFAMQQNHMYFDYWNWVARILIPYRTGETSLFQALTWEFEILSHTHILTFGSMIINERFFGFDLRFFTPVGVASILTYFYIFIRYLQKNENLYSALNTIEGSEKVSFNSQTVWTWGLFLLCASAIFNIAPIAAYWNALVMFENIYLAIAIVYLYAFQKFAKDKRAFPLIICMALTLFFGDAMGNSAVMASIVMLGLLTLFDRSYLKITLIIYAAFIGILFIYKTYFTGEMSHSLFANAPGTQDETHTTLNNHIRMGKYILEHFSKTMETTYRFFGEGFLTHHFNLKIGPITLNDISGYIGMISLSFTALLSLIVLFKNKVEENIFPISLIGFSLVCILGAIFLRIPLHTPEMLAADRYYKFLSILAIGSFLLLYSLWKTKRPAYLTYLFVGFLGLHLANTVSSAHYAWLSIPSVDRVTAKFNVSLGELVRHENDDYLEENLMCRVGGPCRESADYLYSYDLLPGVDNPDIE